jgi:hypothetical protein
LEVRVTDSAGNAASQLLPLSVAEGTAAPLTLAEATLTTPEAGRLECLGTATVPADAGAVQVVEYSLDAGAWQAATSADGEWDSTSEGVTLSLTGLGGGLHSLRLRTVATLPWAVPQVWEQSVEVAEPASGPPPTLALYIPFVSIAVGAY